MAARPGRLESAARAAELGPEYRRAKRESRPIRNPQSRENLVSNLDRTAGQVVAKATRGIGKAIGSEGAPPKKTLEKIASGQ